MTLKNASLKQPLILLALTMFGHLPIGLPPDTGFVIPALIIALIFIGSLNSVENIPPWLIFSLGLVADVLSSGPIGYWPLYYLSAQGLSLWFSDNLANRGLILSWIGFLLTVFVTTFLAWTIATLYFAHTAEWQPMVIGASLIALAFPLIYWATGTGRQNARAAANEDLKMGTFN